VDGSDKMSRALDLWQDQFSNRSTVALRAEINLVGLLLTLSIADDMRQFRSGGGGRGGGGGGNALALTVPVFRLIRSNEFRLHLAWEIRIVAAVWIASTNDSRPQHAKSLMRQHNVNS